MNYTEILAIILGSLAIITYILNTYKGISKPNIEQDTEIVLIKKDIFGIKEDMRDIKVNHLKHIEKDISELKIGVLLLPMEI